MASREEVQDEIEFLMERIEQLRALKRGKRDGSVARPIQEHIEKLQARIWEIEVHRLAA